MDCAETAGERGCIGAAAVKREEGCSDRAACSGSSAARVSKAPTHAASPRALAAELRSNLLDKIGCQADDPEVPSSAKAIISTITCNTWLIGCAIYEYIIETGCAGADKYEHACGGLSRREELMLDRARVLVRKAMEPDAGMDAELRSMCGQSHLPSPVIRMFVWFAQKDDGAGWLASKNQLKFYECKLGFYGTMSASSSGELVDLFNAFLYYYMDELWRRNEGRLLNSSQINYVYGRLACWMVVASQKKNITDRSAAVDGIYRCVESILQERIKNEASLCQ